LFPDTPEAQRRLREALRLVESKTDASGDELELRRKEDGRPTWVQWWSKREAGKYARIMFLDITDQVLMEREKARLEAHNAYLLDQIRTEQNFGDIIGGSSGLRKVMQQVELVAPRCHRFDHRGKRYGKGARRAGHPRAKRATRTPSDQTELQRGA